MNAFVLLSIVVLMTTDFFVLLHLLPPLLKFLPEVVSAVAVLVVIALGVRDRFRNLAPGYWFALGTMVALIVCGVVANNVGPGPLLTGMRGYIRAMPFFLLPIAYSFTERQIKTQVKFILALCLLQLPIAILQRYTSLSAGNSTGDRTSGTLVSSGYLSIFLICCACVLIAYYLRKHISFKLFLPLFLLLLFPTMINETKVTIIVLPVGLLGTFIAGSQPGQRIKNAIVATGILVVFAALFVPIYDYLVVQGHGEHNPKITDFFSSENRVGKYMNTGAQIGAKKAGRVDGLRIPIHETMKTPVRFFLGVGMGNASPSSFGQQFAGEYYAMYQPFLQSTASTFILEIGIIGFLTTLIIQFMIWRDSRWVAENDTGMVGSLAIAWTGITGIVVMVCFYATLHGSPAISFLFWFYGGVIAAQRVRLTASVPSRLHNAAARVSPDRVISSRLPATRRTQLTDF